MKRRGNVKQENAKKKLSITRLENLSNELIYEIFDYLDHCSTYETFINLNLRFQSLFTNSSSPLKINLPLISKSNYEHRCKYIITPNIPRIISLDISKYFLQLFSIELFTSLESLCLHEIPSDQIFPFLTHLISVPQLVSLTIHFSTYCQDENSIYRSIFRLPKLKYCKLTLPSCERRLPLPIATDQCQTLERLIIDGQCRTDQLIAILSYTPNLQHLSCEFLDGCRCEEIEVPIVPLNLTHICLKLYTMPFDELKLFLSKVSFRLKYLTIRKFYDDDYIDAEQWEQLILDYMPLLCIFDFQFSTNDDDDLQMLIDRFSSHFWIERKWFFDYQYYTSEDCSYMNFFSIVPYRLNDFVLHEQINDDDDIPKSYQNNSINFAHHSTIEGHLKVDKYSIRFPQVTKLTLKDINTEETSLCTNDINFICPLIRIKDLCIRDRQFSIGQLIELLSLSPNVQSLRLTYKLPLQSKQTETTHLLSIHNKITKVVIYDDECKLEHAEFLTHLFPRLQCLGIGIDENHLEEIVRFLLSKSNVNNPRDLFSLFFMNANDTTTGKVLGLINLEKLINDYTAEKERGGLHLWW